MFETLRSLAPHLAWRADGPAWLFLVPMIVVTLAAAVFAPAYLRQDRYRHESGLRFALCGVLFVAGMVGAVLAADLVLFLVCWEVMTLASYVLVAHETRDPAALRAAFKYFVMTHCGTACLLLAIVLLRVAGGSFSFVSLPATLATLAATRVGLLHAILALMFVGFATKAGLYPFGDWLPDAHPAAPAPVSAMLSGVMVKLGLYGLLRVFVIALAGSSAAASEAWGWVIGAFGLLSALVGGLAACAASDTKVLLAYSSIAQSGLIALGFGAAMVLGISAPALAALALLGAAFHIVGDAVVKALLFLNAGALQWRTGSRRLEDLGGLFQAMPVTGWTALIGSLAIAGFPPLTAFTAKWLMLQATVLSRTPAVIIAGLGLLVASLLSVLYAVKFFAAAFANRPMRTVPPGSLEVPGSMRAPQLLLAAAVVALGVAPGPALAALARALVAAPALAAGLPFWAGAWVLAPASGALSPLPLMLVGVWAVGLALLALGTGAVARRPVWTGGVPPGADAPGIHPRGYYSPVREAMRRAYPAIPWPHFARPRWIVPAVDLDRWLYRPAGAAGRRVTEGLRRAHTGVPHLYLLWQLAGAAALVLLMLLLLHR